MAAHSKADSLARRIASTEQTFGTVHEGFLALAAIYSDTKSPPLETWDDIKSYIMTPEFISSLSDYSFEITSELKISTEISCDIRAYSMLYFIAASLSRKCARCSQLILQAVKNDHCNIAMPFIRTIDGIHYFSLVFSNYRTGVFVIPLPLIADPSCATFMHQQEVEGMCTGDMICDSPPAAPLVGVEPNPGPSSVVTGVHLCVTCGDSVFLISERGKPYNLPGGKLDAGEDHKSALLRELSEELKVVDELVRGFVDNSVVSTSVSSDRNFISFIYTYHVDEDFDFPKYGLEQFCLSKLHSGGFYDNIAPYTRRHIRDSSGTRIPPTGVVSSMNSIRYGFGIPGLEHEKGKITMSYEIRLRYDVSLDTSFAHGGDITSHYAPMLVTLSRRGDRSVSFSIKCMRRLAVFDIRPPHRGRCVITENGGTPFQIGVHDTSKSEIPYSIGQQVFYDILFKRMPTISRPITLAAWVGLHNIGGHVEGRYPRPCSLPRFRLNYFRIVLQTGGNVAHSMPLYNTAKEAADACKREYAHSRLIRVEKCRERFNDDTSEGSLRLLAGMLFKHTEPPPDTKPLQRQLAAALTSPRLTHYNGELQGWSVSKFNIVHDCIRC